MQAPAVNDRVKANVSAPGETSAGAMSILYDGDIYALQPAGGITRYFESLISRMPANFEVSLIVGDSINKNYPPHPNLKVFEYNQFHEIPFSYRASLYYSKVRNRLRRNSLARGPFDVYHPTYYSRVSHDTYPCPTVITVWDMIHELFPDGLDPNGDFARLKRKAIEAAQGVICISENTKKDLLERYSIAETRVVVTPLAPELNVSSSYGPEAVPSRPYYLYLGSRASYKNFDFLLKAFSKLVEGRKEPALCIVGAPWDQREKLLISDLGIANHLEHFGQVSDDHLAKLYRCSVALVYPSLYEGFGLPPLEAMACGTVAVASNASSIPEVAGDAAVLFDPTSEDELIAILRSLLTDSGRRAELIIKGRQHAQKFSWHQTVSQTIDAYRAAR